VRTYGWPEANTEGQLEAQTSTTAAGWSLGSGISNRFVGAFRPLAVPDDCRSYILQRQRNGRRSSIEDLFALEASPGRYYPLSVVSRNSQEIRQIAQIGSIVSYVLRQIYCLFQTAIRIRPDSAKNCNRSIRDHTKNSSWDCFARRHDLLDRRRIVHNLALDVLERHTHSRSDFGPVSLYVIRNAA